MSKQAEKSGVKPKRKQPPGRPFVKGDPRIAPIMHRAAKAAEEALECPTAPEPGVALPSAAGAVLSEAVRMRRIWERPKGMARLPWERNLLAWLEKDPRGYQSQMLALERAEREEARRAGAGGEEAGEKEPDPGTVKCTDLIEKLIAGLATPPQSPMSSASG